MRHASSTPPRLAVTSLVLSLSFLGAARGGPAGTGRSDYDARPGPAGLQPGAQPSYVADNPANDLLLSFSEDRVLGMPRAAEPSWWFSLALAGVGDEAGSPPPGPARLQAESNRVDYLFEGVRQWYVNDEAGVEQGFTIASPPTGRRGAGPTSLTLDLALGGNLTPTYTPPSYFVELTRPGGDPALRYGDVRATDADGVLLLARLDVRPAAEATGIASIRIVVEASSSAYPITVTVGLRAPRAHAAPRAAPPEGGAGEVVGNPMALEPGITESVAQIMERERLAPAAVPRRPRETHPELEAGLELQDNPDSPRMSHWPPSPQAESAPAIDPPRLPQAMGTSFRGMTLSDAGFVPPDSMGDVGPTQIVVHTNGRIRSFTKGGIPDLALNTTDVGFWAAVAGTGGISDPEVRYDRLSHRWFLLGITVAQATNNKIVIAVSSGPTITGVGSFTFFSFPIGTPSPDDATSFCDYPSLGVDANALYTGCNMFTSTGAFRWTSVFVVRKSSILAFGPIVVTGFSNISNGMTGPGPYAPRGVDNDDPLATEGYIIGTDVVLLGRLNIRRVTNPGGTPVLSPNMQLTVLATTSVSPQQAAGSTTGLDVTDSRLFMASIHQNKLTGESSLWTAHSVETTAACVAASSGNTRRLGARWHEIGSLTTTPAVAQSGTLCTTMAGAHSLNSERGFMFPSVAATGQGHMALGSSFASAAEFAGIAAAGRLRTDTAGGTRVPETILQDGLANYTLIDVSGRNRWGDYSFTDVDPIDDQTVWTVQEYADLDANIWSVRVIQLKAPPPPALASATPVCTGLASAISTVTGIDNCAAPTCTNGLCTGGGVCPEFFDPGPDTGGPGFASHLSATSSGSVTVNPFPASGIVIPGNPSTQRVLQVALSLNTTAAAPGTRNLTITNPDGQTSTGIAILTVNSAPPAPTASSNGPICQGSTLQLSASTIPGAVYAWTGPGGFTSGQQNPSIPLATAAASGTYRVTATVGGCTSSEAITNAAVAPPPGEATGVTVDYVAIAWDSIGGATAYDLVRGSVGALRAGGDFTSATQECLGDDLTDASLPDSAAPAAGQGWWYLVRGVGACGTGTYDSADPSQVAPRDAAIQASAARCP